MTGSYIVVLGSASGAMQARARAAAMARGMGLAPTLDSANMLVFTDAKLTINLLGDNTGVILGDIFCRQQPPYRLDGGGQEMQSATLACREGRLGSQYWGSYVAIGHTDRPGAFAIAHSPFGTLNAYSLELSGAIIVASSAAMLASARGERLSIDWQGLAHALLWDDVCPSETCLDGVREIRCGETVVWSQDTGAQRQWNWDPWQFAGPPAAPVDPAATQAYLRQEIEQSVRMSLDNHDACTIDLSGGLDSSIIASVCAREPSARQAVNIYCEASEGDERGFARSVSDFLGIVLKDGVPDPDRVDPTVCARPQLPRPYARSFVQEIDRIAREVAGLSGATAFLNGGGGDAVFCHLQSSAPAADVLRVHGPGARYFATAYEVARAARCDIRQVLRRSLVKAVVGRHPSQWRSDQGFVSGDGRTTAFTQSPPWPEPGRGILPGKIEHVHALYNSCYNLNGFARSDELEGLFPLLTQPLVETCLQIPSWQWLGQGRNRILARRAFANSLPDDIIWRLSKGGLGELQREVFRRKRPRIREFLLDGRLACQGLLDLHAIDVHLRATGPLAHGSVSRILRLCDLEAWCTSWS
jgi:asparagine synthase (glutamine-hydrolysing)